MSPLVLCSVCIAITLLVSGIAKAKDPASTAVAIVNLKLDRWLPMKAMARYFPWVETVLGLWLLFAPGLFAVLGGIAAVVLFAVYWLVIARAVFTGNTASCNCFGGGSTAPISGFTLGRNTALFAAAVGALLAAITTQKSILGMVLAQDAAGWLWLFGAGVIAVALWCVYRAELVEDQSAPAEKPVVADEFAPTEDSSAPDQDAEEEYIRLPIPYGSLTEAKSGSTSSFRELASQQARVLFWVSPGCRPCRTVIDHIEEWQQKLPMLKINPVVSHQTSVDQLGLDPGIEIFIDEGYQSEVVFGRGTPLAVALGMDGLLAGGPVLGGNTVVDFMNDLMAEFDVA